MGICSSLESRLNSRFYSLARLDNRLAMESPFVRTCNHSKTGVIARRVRQVT